MSKKKNSKSVIITIIITLIVLGGLTFAGIKFLLPQYTNGQETSQYKIYEIAVKVFPLLVGVVLIVIASMIATNHEDEEDEEDKLPPNSYDKQLFEAPADDPTAAAKPVEHENAKQDEVAPEETQEFYSIFDAPAEETKEEEAEGKTAEEAEEPAEDTKKEVAKAAAAAAADPSQKPLLDAIYALVNKLDDMTDLMSYEEEDDDEEDNLDDYEYYDYPEDSEEYKEQYQRHHYDSPLENKIDKLCDAIANLTTIVSSQAGAPVAAPVAVAEPIETEAPAPAEEQPAPAAAPAPAAPAETVIQTVEVPVDKEINDIDATDPIQRARIEFDSAKDGEYDISFVYTNADVDSVLVSLGGTGDAFEINGKTVAIIPFLTGAEAQEEMDKLGVEYEIQTIDANAIMDADFDAEVAPRLA